VLSQFLAIFQDLPGHLSQWTQMFGPWVYAILFAIIFAETGLVVTPLLPGDSLLFAVGALTAIDGGMDFWIALISLIVAGVLGNTVNYEIGRWLSGRLFVQNNAKIFNPVHIERAQAFYARHGGKAIFLTRFAPIIRTYAPFVAGLGKMNRLHFAAYNVFGAVVWVGVFVWAGNRFGNIPSIKTNFHFVILAICVVTVLPAVIEFMRMRRAGAGRDIQGETRS
jgi:membrane-associated protein